MQLDGGLGDIPPGSKNIPVIGAESAQDKLHGTRHYNNKYVWIVTRLYGQNKYASFLISENGISSPVLSSSMVPGTNIIRNGEIKLSQDGTKLIALYKSDSIAEVCNFNSQNGEIIPLFLFRPSYSTKASPDFAEFSTDTKSLYVNGMIHLTSPSIDASRIFQYDLSKTDSSEFMQSQILIGSHNHGRGLQLGPDGKIYQSINWVDSLNVINNPNIQGIGCNFQANEICLDGRIAYEGLPQFLQKYKAHIHRSGHCQNEIIHFWGDIWPPADSIHWDFGDPTSGAANYSNDSIPSHVYAIPGQYTVELFVRYIDNRTDTSWLTITIHESPSPSLGPDPTICQGDSATFDAGFCSGCSYEWTSIPLGFSSTEQTITIGQAGIYEVIVTSANGCTGIDTVQLTVTVPPAVTNTPLSKSICSGESTDIMLTSTLPNTTFSWTAMGSSPFVIGFSPGSGDTINQVLFNSGSDAETVIYAITPAVGSCVGDSVQFVVTVTPGDSVMISISSSADSVCAGTPVTFTATSTNGGATPAYQWKVDGLNQGTNDSLFTYAPVNRDSVTCVLTSSNTSCTTNNPDTSNAIILTVNQNLPVSILIVASANPVCEGDSVMFTGTTVNGGYMSDYQWLVNGDPVGTNDSTFTYTPVNDDSVRCVLTSSETCTSSNPVSSNQVYMIVNPILLVGITISPSANPVCGGSPVTFTAMPINGGSSPDYQWKVNANNAGINNAVFTYTLVDGDVVSCILTSNEDCVTGNPATSNSISMIVGEQPDVSFSACFDTITTLNAKPYKLKGGIPLRGVYSGPGVDQITGYFNPTMAGLGTKTISYSYTNWYNCSDNEIRSINVVNLGPFTCGNDLLDIRDSTVYPTVQIGTQCWMATNLNYGTEIPYTTPQRGNCIPEKYESAVGSWQSAVYQWDELMCYQDAEGLQGLCPPGWHMPSESDWNQLFVFYQGNAFAGSPLLYSGYSGFNVQLTGISGFNKNWYFDGFATMFWSSTSHGPWKAWAHGMNDYNYSVSYYPSYRANAFSVRCLRD